MAIYIKNTIIKMVAVNVFTKFFFIHVYWDTFARNRQGSSNSYTITAPDGTELTDAWIYKKDKFLKLLNDGEVRFKKLKNKWSVQVKQRINANGQIMRSIINDFTNEQGTKSVNEFLGKEVFSYAKPVELVKYFMKSINEKDSIILDFFSGSSTTAQSIIEFNNDEKANHKFLLIQIPEMINIKSKAYKAGYRNICEIGKERIRRAGDKIIEESDNKDLDIGFKVFKLDSSNLEKWDPDYNNLEQTLLTNKENVKPDRTELDLIYEIMLKYGIDLTLPIEKINNIYSIGYGALLICLDDNITKEIAEKIIKLKSDDITRVVFKESSFKSDADKTNIKETLRINNINEFITI